MDGVTILNTFVEELAVIQPWCTISLTLSVGGIMGLITYAMLVVATSNYDRAGTVVTICAICVFTR